MDEHTGAGACRPGALTAVVSGDPASACEDPYAGAAVGGLASYDLGFLGPNTVHVRALAAVPQNAPFAVRPAVEDFVRLDLSHGLTAGTNACGGSAVPLGLDIGIIQLMSSIPSDNIQLLGSSGADGSPATVTRQGGHLPRYAVVLERTGFFASLVCSPSPPDPTRRSTWGTLKSLYT